MSTPTLKEHLRKSLTQAKKMYLDDLESMPHEQLDQAPGGSARTPYDFTYEVVLVNRRIAARLRGADPGPALGEGWTKAPDTFRSKEAAINEFSNSMDAVIGGWDALAEDQIGTKIETPTGETTPHELAALAAHHAGYHDAQLNYHQAICGDEAVHWDFS